MWGVSPAQHALRWEPRLNQPVLHDPVGGLEQVWPGVRVALVMGDVSRGQAGKSLPLPS